MTKKLINKTGKLNLSILIDLSMKIALIASIVLVSAKFLFFFSSSSLWIDEIYSIQSFSAKGFLVSVTDYHVPNNHILFNALNSIIPKQNPFSSLEARIVSFIAFVLAMVLPMYMLKKQTSIVWILLLFAFIVAEPRLLELVLQARGYGLTFLFTLLNCCLVLTLFDNHKNSLKLLVLVNVLAIYTIPSYAIFTGSLFVGLLILNKNRLNIIKYGFLLLSVTLIIHLPVLKQILSYAREYGDIWGRGFKDGQAMFDVFTKYSLLTGDWLVLPFVIAPLLLMNISRVQSKSKSAVIVLYFAFTTCFSIYHLMETPIVRTSFFLFIPVLFSLAILMSDLIKTGTLSLIIPLVLTSVISYHIVRVLIGYQPRPDENWKGVASYIHSNFDEGTLVYCNFRSELLSIYLKSDYPLSDEFDSLKFVNGGLIYVQSNHINKSYPETEIAYRNIRLPQRRGGSQEILYHDPNIKVKKLADTQIVSSNCCKWESHDLLLPPHQRLHSVSYEISNVVADSEFQSQLMLRTKSKKDYYWLPLKMDPSKPITIPISEMKVVGQPTFNDLTLLSIRIKQKSKAESVLLELKNIKINYE